MNLSNNFSRNLSLLRKVHGSTLTEFADEISVSRSYLQNVLNGSCNPTLDTVEHIAKELQIRPDLLLSFPDEADSEKLPPLFLQNIREMKTHLQIALRILEEMLPEESSTSENP